MSESVAVDLSEAQRAQLAADYGEEVLEKLEQATAVQRTMLAAAMAAREALGWAAEAYWECNPEPNDRYDIARDAVIEYKEACLEDIGIEVRQPDGWYWVKGEDDELLAGPFRSESLAGEWATKHASDKPVTVEYGLKPEHTFAV